MSPEPIDGSVIVYDAEQHVYEPSPLTLDGLGVGGTEAQVSLTIGHSENSMFYEVPQSGFETVDFTVPPTTNIGGGIWNEETQTWTVPITGRYLILARIRGEDNMPARSVGVGVHTSNDDGPYFTWRKMGETRDVQSYLRIDTFTAGQELRLFLYSEGRTFPLMATTLTIDKIN